MHHKAMAALIGLLQLLAWPALAADPGRLVLVPSSGQVAADGECAGLLSFVKTRLDAGFPETLLSAPVQDIDQPEPDSEKYVELSPPDTRLLISQTWLLDGSAVKIFGHCQERYFYLARTGTTDGTVRWFGPYAMPGDTAGVRPAAVAAPAHAP